MPNAIPYVVSYYKKNWGFCLSYNEYKKLKKGKYKIFIDTELTKGSMTYGEILIPGKMKDEILFSTYICHPSLANNEVSGPALLTYIVKFLNSYDKKPKQAISLSVFFESLINFCNNSKGLPLRN